ncbi:MAG: hypothetical protein WCG47_12780 [Dermatophilaceae bacterium]
MIAAASTAGFVLIPSSTDKQVDQASKALTASLTQVSTAQKPSDVRSAGAAAADQAAATSAFLATLPSDGAPADLVALSKALSAVTSLKGASGENPAAWTEAEPVLRASATTDVQEAGVPASLINSAVQNVDKIIDPAAATYQKWQSDNSAAVAQRDAAISGATSYKESMKHAIDKYTRLRNDLSDYIEVIDTKGSTVDVARAQFNKGASDRRDVRDTMLSLSPPAAAAAAHNRLVNVVSDGVAGTESALRGLDTATCYWGECFVQDTSAYQTFRSESKRITAAYDAALADWNTAAQQAIDAAKAMPLPAKPEV